MGIIAAISKILRWNWHIQFPLPYPLKLRIEITAHGVTNYEMYVSYFRDIGSIKVSETSYTWSMAATDDNLLYFYWVEVNNYPVDDFKIYYASVFGAGISQWCHHPQFLSAHFLAYQASCHVKSGVFRIGKYYLTNARKFVLLFSFPLTCTEFLCVYTYVHFILVEM